MIQKKEIERQLHRAAKQKVTLEEDKKQENIRRIVEMDLPVSKNGTIKDFFKSQICFLNKTVVFWQILWIICFSYLLKNRELFPVNHEVLSLVSMIPPLLLLLTVEEITRVYQRSMLEIEYATKYSLKKVVMVRLLILSVMNGLVLLFGAFVAKKELQITLIDIILYGMTPMIWMTSFILLFMKKWMGEQLKYASISCYVICFLMLMIGGRKRVSIYAEVYRNVWVLLLVIGVVALVYQVMKLHRHLSKFEWMMEE